MRKSAFLVMSVAAAALAACGEAPQQSKATASGATNAPAGVVQTAAVGNVNSPCGWYGPFDGNGDGAIDRIEYDNFGNVQFERWDLDDNGGVSAQEFQQCAKDGAYSRLAGTFAGFDANGDGRASNGEFFASNMFTKLDTDRSGKLENDEWSSAA